MYLKAKQKAPSVYLLKEGGLTKCKLTKCSLCKDQNTLTIPRPLQDKSTLWLAQGGRSPLPLSLRPVVPAHPSHAPPP